MSETLGGARVLVTGGQGFIGRHVVAALHAGGAETTVVVHPDDAGSDGVPVDLADRDAVVATAAGHDAIVHLAARSGGIQFQRSGDVFDANRTMTDNVLHSARVSDVGRVFLASSVVVYAPSDAPLREDDPVVEPGDPGANPYALSKVEDERAGRTADGIEVVIGRFGNVYGPGATFDPDRATVVHSLIDRAARSEDSLSVWGDGSAVRSFIHVADVAAAVVGILETGVPGSVYNVDGGIPVSIADLAGVVRDAVAPTLEIVFDPTKPSGAPYRVASIDALRALGFAPSRTLDAGVSETVEWYRRRGSGDPHPQG